MYQQKFLKLAKKLFKIFLPLEIQSGVSGQILGCCLCLAAGKHILSSIDIDAFLTCRDQDCDDFFTWKMKIPDVLGDAWLHLIMSLVQRVHHHSREADEELKACHRAVSKGREEILQSYPLDEREAVLSSGVASLVVQNLIYHGVSGQPDIHSTYFEYLDRLVRRARFECFENGKCEPIQQADAFAGSSGT